MASHTRNYGEPREVAGYIVRFTITTFTDSVARSLDAYAYDNDEGILLTEDSLDEMPSDSEVAALLDQACDEGKLSCQWDVNYVIASAGDHATVAQGHCEVIANNAGEAAIKAIDWVHEHDSRHDARIHPVVGIVDTERREIMASDPIEKPSWLRSSVTVTVPEHLWETNDGMDNPTDRLSVTLLVGRYPMHFEAWAVTYDDEAMIQHAADGDDSDLDHLFAAVGGDGSFQTTTIRGRQYILVASPFCD
jgi:hypothetical protein